MEMKIFNKRDLSIRPKMLKLLSGNREKIMINID